MVEDEFSNPCVTEIQKCLADEDYRWQCLHGVCPFHMNTKASNFERLLFYGSSYAYIVYCGSGAMGFYVLLRAVDRFTANYNKFPGQFDG